MSGWRLACMLPLVLAGGVAFAQSGQQQDRPIVPAAPKKMSPEEAQAVQKRVADWLKTCLEDWDHTTHMSKKEWRVTCQRVSAERGKFLAQNPAMFTGAPKSRRP
jgi:hypothetical protein